MIIDLARIIYEQDTFVGLNKIAEILSRDKIYTSPCIYFLSMLDDAYVNVSGNYGATKLPVDVPRNTQTEIVVKREECTLAFVTGDLQNAVPHGIKEVVSSLLLYFFELMFSANYFKEIRKPIDFTNTSLYYPETVALLSSALGMPMVAIRKLSTNDDLKCLCFYEFGKPTISGNDFFDSDMPPPFKEVLVNSENMLAENRQAEIVPTYHCNIDLNNPTYAFLKNNLSLEKVKTFIIFPIIYGHELFGVMSCASRCRYVFSENQKNAISGLMQIIGVAISNYLRYHEAQELHVFRTEQIVDTTAVEVAKSTKHELSNAQAETSTMLVELKRAVATNQTNKIQAAIGKLETAIDNLLPSIQKLSFGDKADSDKIETSIKAIWDGVTVLFSERLKRSQISTYYQGPECKGLFHAEMLKNAFLNLILNSIDAFKTQTMRGRKITVVTTSVGNGTRCQIDFSDNAGGLIMSPSSYRIPEHISRAQPDLPLKELIFLPKVSSKGGLGSGWGLYLVRRAVSMHKGSIDLINAKNGCTFRIDIPCRP